MQAEGEDFRTREGVPHLKVSGKGGKTRYLPLHPGTNGLINDYLAAAGQSIGWCEDIRRNWGSRSARTRYARPPPPMR